MSKRFVQQSWSSFPSNLNDMELFIGTVSGPTALFALSEPRDMQYVIRLDTNSLWQYQEKAGGWVDLQTPANVENISGVQVDFDNVNNVTINYSGYVSRPILEIWVDTDQGVTQAEANVQYNTSAKTLQVSFGNSFESGYLILK